MSPRVNPTRAEPRLNPKRLGNSVARLFTSVARLLFPTNACTLSAVQQQYSSCATLVSCTYSCSGSLFVEFPKGKRSLHNGGSKLHRILHFCCRNPYAGVKAVRLVTDRNRRPRVATSRRKRPTLARDHHLPSLPSLGAAYENALIIMIPLLSSNPSEMTTVCVKSIMVERCMLQREVEGPNGRSRFKRTKLLRPIRVRPPRQMLQGMATNAPMLQASALPNSLKEA